MLKNGLGKKVKEKNGLRGQILYVFHNLKKTIICTEQVTVMSHNFSNMIFLPKSSGVKSTC